MSRLDSLYAHYRVVSTHPPVVGRYRRAVHPGDVVVIEAMVLRLRSRMGLLKGVARVDGKVVVEGTMTFALGPASGAQK
jgi:acyl-CoA thioesterase FadM